MNGVESTMRDGLNRFAADPQIAHNLSLPALFRTVDNLWTMFALWGCNEPSGEHLRMDARGFLPTMKLQPSQLP
jgi:hypothetical protein